MFEPSGTFAFPDSFLAASDRASQRWRQDFIRTYLERDIPLLRPRIPAETLRRFWTMLAHHQSSLLNSAEFARALGVDGKTIASYLELLVDLLLVRRLEPWHANVRKRLVKSPRVYVRDSGIAHTLLGLTALEDIFAHPVAGASWEGFVIETLIVVAPSGTEANFYRTSAGADIDLLMTPPGSRPWAIEIKRSLTPRVEKGFHLACEDIDPSLGRLSGSRALSAETRHRSGAAAHPCENAGRTWMTAHRTSWKRGQM